METTTTECVLCQELDEASKVTTELFEDEEVEGKLFGARDYVPKREEEVDTGVVAG